MRGDSVTAYYVNLHLELTSDGLERLLGAAATCSRHFSVPTPVFLGQLSPFDLDWLLAQDCPDC